MKLALSCHPRTTTNGRQLKLMDKARKNYEVYDCKSDNLYTNIRQVLANNIDYEHKLCYKNLNHIAYKGRNI